jgi:hypothetical protein
MHCNNLIQSIRIKDILELFKIISVDDKNIKIPPIIVSVPTMIVRGINKPLIGKEVFSWLDAQQFLNIKTNNITNEIVNPIFHVDNMKAIELDINYISFNNNDELNKKLVQFNKMNEIFITDDINKKIQDNKINNEIQNKKLNQIINNRNLQIETLLNNNKNY